MGESSGCGVIEYANAACARRAVHELTGTCIDDHTIKVEVDPRPRGDPKARVFFHNVSWTMTEKLLRKEFENIGEIREFELRVKQDGRSLGMGSCLYLHVKDAERAIDTLNGKKVGGRLMYVNEYDAAP